MPCMPRSQFVQPFKIRLWLWINRPTKCYQFVVCAEFDNNCRDDRHETAIHPMDSMRCTADCVASISAHSNTTNQIGDKQLIKNNRASCSIALLPKNASKFHWICSDHCEPIFWMRLLWRWADWQMPSVVDGDAVLGVNNTQREREQAPVRRTWDPIAHYITIEVRTDERERENMMRRNKLGDNMNIDVCIVFNK